MLGNLPLFVTPLSPLLSVGWSDPYARQFAPFVTPLSPLLSVGRSDPCTTQTPPHLAVQDLCLANSFKCVNFLNAQICGLKVYKYFWKWDDSTNISFGTQIIIVPNCHYLRPKFPMFIR